jgi:hypothetical protein
MIVQKYKDWQSVDLSMVVGPGSYRLEMVKVQPNANLGTALVDLSETFYYIDEFAC